MMKTVNQIIEVQDELKNKFGETHYNETIALVKERCENNVLIMAAVASDVNNSSGVKLFAIAAMGG